MFSSLVIGYLFLGGTGAGMMFLLCLLECFNARRRFGDVSTHSRLGRTFAGRTMLPAHSLSIRPKRKGTTLATDASYVYVQTETKRDVVFRWFALPSEFFSRAWPVCLGCLCISILCLFADLGHPERIVNLLIHPSFSVMTVGAYALIAAFLLALAFTVLVLLDGFFPKARAVVVLSVLGCIAAMVVMTYTGVLLSSLASVLFWQTPLLPLVFVLSSLSCGIAAVFFVAVFVEARQPIIASLNSLARADGVLIVLEMLTLAGYLAWALSNEGTAQAAFAFIKGDLAVLFWVALVSVGLLLPLMLERFVTYSNYRSQLIWVAAAVLCGGLALRACMVYAGDYDATQLFQGMQNAASISILLGN